jgi:DNA-binding CsgD family transcriptional regulator
MKTIAMKSWNDAVADVIRFGFSDEAISTLIYELAGMLSSHASTLILFSRDSRPQWPFKTRMSDREWKSLSLSYRDGAYLMDPFYHLVRKGSEGVFRLQAEVPDEFRKTEFYKIFYERLNVIDEMCAITRCSDSVVALISVCRVDQEEAYSQADFDVLYSCFSVIEVLVRKWWNLKYSDACVDDPGLVPRLEAALENFGAPLLTPREMQVARLSLEGHSVKSQALTLNVSTETIKSYRKNIYIKLGIKSQAELFNAFIDSVKSESTFHTAAGR